MGNSEFTFVDKCFKFLSEGKEEKERRFAILIGDQDIEVWSPGANGYVWKRVNVYISAIPIAKARTMEEAGEYIARLSSENRNCLVARLVSVDEIEAINEWGRFCGFKIESAKTSTDVVDMHGRRDYFLRWDGKAVPDNEAEVSNVYLCFMLDADVKQELRFN